ncbi:MAG: class B sortase [Ruminococcaceae bacterium]|nr:class B sortase [Oscillospiraceae bacterium]
MDNNGAATRRGKGRLIFWLVLFIVCVITVAACVGVWVYHAVLRKAMSDLYEEARVVINVSPDEKGDGTGSLVIDAPFGSEDEVVMINFDLLKKTSADVYAWIEIPGTPIAFPIVQHPKNNEYYLRRAINGAYDITGCIYTQNYNSLDFTDKNTIIYGHYMDDGTKFGPLLSYMDKEFFEDHKKIVIYTETEKLTYEVFAALPFNTRHILRSYVVSDDPHAEFLSDVYSSTDARRVIDKENKADAKNDKIITLSTCLKTGSKRYIVLAKLIDHNNVNK